MLRKLFSLEAWTGGAAVSRPAGAFDAPPVTAEMREHVAWLGLRHFRSAPFRMDGSVYKNHEEYWDAVREGRNAWTVRCVSQYDALTGPAAGGRVVETKPVYEKVCFYEALYRLAEYEATQDDLHRLSGVTRLEMPPGAMHCRDAGHAEAFIFDLQGYPHMTKAGLPTGPAKFAAEELALAAALARQSFFSPVRYEFMSQMFPAWKMEAVDPGYLREKEQGVNAARKMRKIGEDIAKMKEDFLSLSNRMKGKAEELPYDTRGRALGVLFAAEDIDDLARQPLSGLLTGIVGSIRDMTADLATVAVGIGMSIGIHYKEDRYYISMDEFKACAARAPSLSGDMAQSLGAYMLQSRTNKELKKMVGEACARAVRVCSELEDYIEAVADAVVKGERVWLPNAGLNIEDAFPGAFNGAGRGDAGAALEARAAQADEPSRRTGPFYTLLPPPDEMRSGPS